MILKLEKKLKPINFTEFDVIEKFDSLNSIKNSDNKISSFLTFKKDVINSVNFVLCLYTRSRIFKIN